VFDSNLQALNETIEKEANLDLVLYGDSIIERMNGRVFGEPIEDLQDQLAITRQFFTKEGGGKINALPLGIAGEEVRYLYLQMNVMFSLSHDLIDPIDMLRNDRYIRSCTGSRMEKCPTLSNQHCGGS
jgi:hypothetical protein